MDDFIKILKQDEITDRLMAQIDSITKKRHLLQNHGSKNDKRILYDPTNHFEQQESKRELWLKLVKDNVDLSTYPSPNLVHFLPQKVIVTWLVKIDVAADIETSTETLN